MERGNLKLLLKITGVAYVCFLVFPPSELASFYIGCSTGNFQPSNTCTRLCRMVNENFTSCCYGVNHAGRSACGCCLDVGRDCPQNCAANCFMMSLNCDNCAGGNVLGQLPKKEGDLDGSISLEQFFNGPDLIPVRDEDQFWNRQCAMNSGLRNKDYCPLKQY